MTIAIFILNKSYLQTTHWDVWPELTLNHSAPPPDVALFEIWTLSKIQDVLKELNQLFSKDAATGRVANVKLASKMWLMKLWS